MVDKKKERRSLEEILQSTSDVIFPEDIVEKQIFIDSKSIEGDTPLHVMVWRNDRYAVQVLIDSGAELNALGDMSESPLHVAVGQKDLVIIESLLKAGAKTDIRSEFGETAAERARKKGGKILKLFKIYEAL